MGDPKKLRKKYSPPRHPWQGSRILAEKPLVKDYGLKNKREIYIAQSILRNFTKQAKNLTAIKNLQSQREKEQLLARLERLNLLGKNAGLDQVLGLTINNILDRRLQTLVYKKGLAKTPEQSRQLITHGHIVVRGQKVNVPGYLVKADEENTIEFVKSSSFSNHEHPERVVKEKPELKKEINPNIE